MKFQLIQDELNKILVKVVIDKDTFTEKDLKVFTQNLRERTGEKMTINFEFTEDLKNESSGKFRMVKNNIKHLIEKPE